jgi:hypothetical protein
MEKVVLSRRGLLTGAGAGAAVAALSGAWPAEAAARTGRPMSLPVKELEALAAPFSKADDRVAHLLHRATYGVRPGELERARQMGIEAWLEEQLHPETIDDSGVEAKATSVPASTPSTPISRTAWGGSRS